MVTYLRSVETNYSMETLLRTIGKTRQQYYQSKKRFDEKTKDEQKILDLVRNWREVHPRMGSRTMYYSLLEQGVNLVVGVNRFERLLSENDMTVGKIKRSGPYTSDGKGKGDHPNLTNGLELSSINQLVVSDITYIWIKNRWYYLFTLKDVYSQRLVSLIPSEDMKATHVLATLVELEKLRGKEELKGCIYHSDNGSQYEWGVFLSSISTLEMQVSRAETCQQNGSAEQLNHILKNMYLKHYGIASFSDLQRACKEVKDLMNEKRSVSQLGNTTVSKFEKSLYDIPMDQRIVKKMYDFKT